MMRCEHLLHVRRGLSGLLGVLLISAGSAQAEWSTSPASPTLVAGGNADQAVPLVRAAGLNGTWVVFADNAGGGGYKYAIQRITQPGNPAFVQPVVLSPTRTNTATFRIDLSAYVNEYSVPGARGDPEVIVAFDSGSIVLQKVLLNGSLPWGANGVTIPGSTGALGPVVVAFNDGSCVVAWGSGSTINFQRVNPNGSMGPNWQYSEAGRGLLPSDMLPYADASGLPGVALLWVQSETTNTVTSRKGLRLQAWSASGVPVWNTVPVIIYESSASPLRSIQNGYFPVLKPSVDGYTVAWYDNGADRNAWLQSIDSASGSLRFPAGGLAVFNSSQTLRLSADASYDFLTQSFTIASVISNPNQSAFGLAVERVNLAGTRLWSSGAGVPVVPLGPNPVAAPVLGIRSEDLFWLQYDGPNGPMRVRGARLDPSTGAPTPPGSFDIASTQTSKGNLAAVPSLFTTVAVWADGAAGARDIRGANVASGGTLGWAGPVCDSIDFNNDGLQEDPTDIEAFLSVYSGGPCIPVVQPCGDVDFNNDDIEFDPTDIGAFLSVYSSGPCF